MRLGRIVLATLAAACGLIPMAQMAESGTRTEHLVVRSGVHTKLFTWVNCVRHVAFQGSVFVEHWTIDYKGSTIDACGNAAEPSRELWYTSTPGFRGTDTVTTGGQFALELAVTVR